MKVKQLISEDLTEGKRLRDSNHIKRVEAALNKDDGIMDVIVDKIFEVAGKDLAHYFSIKGIK